VKDIIYVAHPVSGDVKANCEKVLLWLRWLTEKDPSRIYIAPWVGEVMAHLDQDPIPAAFYDRVLSDDEEVVARLDGILLCGVGTTGPYARPNGLMKSTGMTREVAAAALAGNYIIDLRRFANPDEAQARMDDWGMSNGTAFINDYTIRTQSEEWP
jgi:hypothetical protein